MMKRQNLETIVFNKIRFYRKVDESSPTNRNILNAGEKFLKIFKQLKKNTDKIKLSDFLKKYIYHTNWTMINIKFLH